MAFLKNIFKKKRAEKPVKQAKPKIEKPLKKEVVFKPKKTEQKAISPAKKEKEKTKPIAKKQDKSGKIASKNLVSPHITEKASVLADEQNQYVFKVSPRATKNEIKKAVAERYSVKVEKVNIVNVKKKAKRLGRTKGFKAGYKKAIVRLQKGQTLEILPR